MSETLSSEHVGRRLDGLQNSVSSVTRRIVTLEITLSERMGAIEAGLAELGECADQLSDRIGGLETRVNYLILLAERIANAKTGPGPQRV